MPKRVIIIVLLVPMLAAGFFAWRISRAPKVPPGNPPAPPGPPLIVLEGPTMGSAWTVKLPQLPAGQTREQMAAAVQAVLDGIDSRMSTFKPESDLSRFNRHRGTDWFEVPADVAQVVERAQEISQQTGGVFDVTVGPLVNLWGFGPERPAGEFGTIPSDESIAEAKRHVGYHLLHVRQDPPALRKDDPAVYVDLSAIGKGYAADAVARRLEELGVPDFLIDIGGELRAKGVSNRGRPWRIGIESPALEAPPSVAQNVLLRVELRDIAVATSGDYRNFFEKDGRRYSHEIDPRTGRPVAGDLTSVSVVHASGADADALATALMVLGADEGYQLAQRMGLAALFITRRGTRVETKMTPEYERLVVKASTTTSPSSAR